jgi:hypothetical protein
MIVVTAAETKGNPNYDAAQVHESLLFAIVCHRVGVDSEAAIGAATYPAGTSGGWQFVERENLPEGWWEGDGARMASPTDDPHDAPYPQPCGEHTETHVHVLAAC